MLLNVIIHVNSPSTLIPKNKKAIEFRTCYVIDTQTRIPHLLYIQIKVTKSVSQNQRRRRTLFFALL